MSEEPRQYATASHAYGARISALASENERLKREKSESKPVRTSWSNYENGEIARNEKIDHSLPMGMAAQLLREAFQRIHELENRIKQLESIIQP